MSRVLTVYKSLRDGVSTVQAYKWPLPEHGQPGDWVDTDPKKPVALCVYGVHGWLTRRKAEQEGDQVFEMEIEGEIVKDQDKAAGRRGRLLRQLSGRRTATLGEVAASITAGALLGTSATALQSAVTSLGVTATSLEKALPDAYVVDDADHIVKLAEYLRKVKPAGDEVERRVWALREYPLRLEIARV